MKTRIFSLALASSLVALPALAQDGAGVNGAEVKEAMKKSAEKPIPDGWTKSLSLGANISLNHSSKVVGQPDGSTFQFGVQLQGAANWKSGDHEWTNRLSLIHTQTQTPQIESFVKTADELEIRSMYLYSIPGMDWMGPFARFRLSTAVAPGYLVYSEDTRINAIPTDGTPTSQILQAQRRLKVTDGFEPLILRESAGMFIRAVRKKDVQVTVTAGVGAQETLVGEGYVVSNTDTPGVVELTQLQDRNTIGAELELDANGAFNELVTWAFNANMLYPFYTDPTLDPEPEALDSIITTVSGKLSVKLADWASLDYTLSAKRDPTVTDEWQVQNGLLLTSSFNLL